MRDMQIWDMQIWDMQIWDMQICDMQICDMEIWDMQIWDMKNGSWSDLPLCCSRDEFFSCANSTSSGQHFDFGSRFLSSGRITTSTIECNERPMSKRPSCE